MKNSRSEMSLTQPVNANHAICRGLRKQEVGCKAKIAVLLAAHNGEKYINSQVDSILNQEGVEPYVYISVDSGSKDRTLEISRFLMHRHDNVFLLDHNETFGGAAKNFFWLIRNAPLDQYDYVALSDQDDIWESDHLLRGIGVMNGRGACCYSSDVRAFWEGKPGCRIVKKSYPQARFDYYFQSAGPGCTYILRRNVMGEFRGFLCRHWHHASKVELHDWLIYAYCRSRGFEWVIDDFPSVHYRQHASNEFGVNFGARAALSRLYRVKAEWYSRQIRNIYEMVGPPNEVEFKLERRFLLRNFWHLRRRPRDKVILFCLILFGLVR